MTRSYTARAGARAALALVLVASAPPITAYADDEYGTDREGLIRHAAGSITRAAPLPQRVAALYEQFAVGENNNFAAPGREALIRKAASSGAARPESAALP